MERIVVKVGGSLFDWPKLATALQSWLATLDGHIILVPGGGATANVVREFDRVHQLGEEKAHWLALRTLTCNAHFLAALLPDSSVAGTLEECDMLHSGGHTAIMDAHQFAVDDEAHSQHLPHAWAVTSDSIAARIAVCWRADRLILLKSTSLPPDIDWLDAGRAGYVDSYFHNVAKTLRVETVNLRLVRGQ